MRHAGSYMISAMIHAAGLALLAWSPGVSHPESAVSSGGVDTGALLDAVATAAATGNAPLVEFETVPPLTADSFPSLPAGVLPADSSSTSSGDVALSPDAAFAPERTPLPLDRPVTIAMAPDALPVSEVRSAAPGALAAMRPLPQRIGRAELAAWALAERVRSSDPPETSIQRDAADARDRGAVNRPATDRRTMAGKPAQSTGPRPAERAGLSGTSQPAENQTVTNQTAALSGQPGLDRTRPQQHPANQSSSKQFSSQQKSQQQKPPEQSLSEPNPVAAAAERKRNSEASAPSRTGGASPQAGVDEYPRILPVNAQPEYPLDALRSGQQGRVLLAVLVSERGAASQVRVLRSCGYRSLDDSAVTAVRTWKFRPAERAGRPVACWVKVPISFRIDTSGADR